MKRLRVFVLVLLGLLAVVGMAAASVTGFTLPWWTADGGGGMSAGGSYTVAGTIGQPDSGAMSGGQYEVNGGFWNPGGVFSPPGRVIYLPVVVR